METNNTENMETSKPVSGYEATLKSRDTEEHIDLAFYRPIGYFWACIANKLHITPNAITIFSIFVGMAAGWAFYYTDIYVNIVGMILLVLANTLDAADGQLARMTKQYSQIGRILDGMSGDFWFGAVYVAICLRVNIHEPFFAAHPWLIWTIAVVTGLCHAKQAAMADYYRQTHLFFLKGKDRSELDNSQEIAKRIAELSWKKNFLKKLTLCIYINYTRSQEAVTPAMQKMLHELGERFPDGDIPQSFRDAFRKLSLPLMKYTNILSFNWRVITLFISLFLNMPWLYFVAELTIFNILLVYMVWRHERACRILTKQLQDGLY